MARLQQQQVGQYVIGPEIGRGSFANVYKGYDSKTNQPIAIKSVFRSKLKNKKLLENLEIEISILKNLKHPHIVLLIDCQRTQQHFHLFMEYCSLGDLSYFIRKRDQLVNTHPLINSILERYPSPPASHGLNKILVINFLKQLASALEFLRDANLVHRDIKPQNLLLCYPSHSQQQFVDLKYAGMWELPILKIADFGFARILPNTSLLETLCGSPLYMAPEILRYEKYNAKADLWSVGAVLYEMSVGHPPFKASNHVELLRKIEKTKDRISFPLVAQVDEDIIRLICGLLKCNPTERMGFQEFFQDPLITTDLESTNKSLDLSNLDENLFISEYLSSNNRNNHSNRPDPVLSDVKEKSLSPDDSLLIAKESQRNSIKESQVVKPRSKDDVFIEKDYVVVEKRTVEVNALADELQSAGTGDIAIQQQQHAPIVHRYSSSSRSSSGASNRRPSFNERRVSISVSPTNALSKALGVASARLFGAQQISPYVIENPLTKASVQNFQPQLHTNNNNPNSTALVSAAGQILADDYEIILLLESLATKAHAILLFAEIKFSQLLPLPPSTNSESANVNTMIDEEMNPGEKLPLMMTKTICEEGLALYIKTLSLLSKLMKLTTSWWSSNGSSKQPPARLIGLVQWIRERYNTALDKLEFLRTELNDILIKNPSMSESSSKIIPEKLIFNRALEISRRAAEDELNNVKLVNCELAYSTAIWMLELVLDDGDLEESKISSTLQGQSKRLDEDDALTVESFIESIGKRLNILRRKMNLQNASNRNSPQPHDL